jgi:hypothetical protein
MAMTFEQAVLSVWHQALVEDLTIVALDGNEFSVRSTPKQHLKQIDFRFDGRDLRGLEQNPNTRSRWAELATNGAKVMQFLEHGRYLAVVADGKMHQYHRKSN